jgi:hypothetical protein
LTTTVVIGRIDAPALDTLRIPERECGLAERFIPPAPLAPATTSNP